MEIGQARTSGGQTLAELSAERPVLLVCLRHLGCAFAREALADLADQRQVIGDAGATLVIAHLDREEAAQPLFARYGLSDVARVGDPHAALYEACALTRGGLPQLLTPYVFWRWVSAALLRGHGASWTGADVRRMPGAFLLEAGRITRAFRHRTSAERPDYAGLCRGEGGRDSTSPMR